jgi:hypothetical protein
VACPLLWALVSVAEARPKSPPGAHHVAASVLARQGEARPEARPDDGRSPAIEVIPFLPPEDGTMATFVDPAGGHARVLPIETASPYRAR